MNPTIEISFKTAQAYSAMCKPLCQELKLPQTAFDIQMFLANNPDCTTARDIVEIRKIKANLVSVNVDRLVQEGYLERRAVAGDQFRERCPGFGAFGDDGLVVLDARKLPAFADVALVGGDSLVRGDLLAAPDHGTQERFEFQRIHDIYRFCKILFLPELPSTQSKRLLYLLGVQPTTFLKSLVKCAGYLNPSS